jgi:hypothetical protein
VNRAAGLAALASVLLLSGGCSTVRLAGSAADRDAVDLDTVPFFPQTTHHCGPASLAEALGASGVAVDPGALATEVYVPGLAGSLQAELMASARRHGRIAYTIRPALDALVAELNAGRPVLVLQNFGIARAPAWHYAVVVGYRRAQGQLLLRTGTSRRDVVAVTRFDATWRRADRWGIVLVKPDEPPADAELGAWLTAAGELSATAGREIAAPAYAAAVGRWPGASQSWLGLGNARLTAGDVSGAEAAFTSAIRIEPGAIAPRNNLALLLGGRGCFHAAMAAIGRARADARGTAFEAEVEDSARQIAGAPTDDAASCPSPNAVR